MPTTPFRDLPLADRADAWDADAAEASVRRWASSDGSGDKESMDWPKYAKAFFWYDGENDESFTGYKLGFARVADGRLEAVPRGVFACAAVLQGSRGGVDIPASDVAAVKAHVAKYYAKMDLEPPWSQQADSVRIMDARRQKGGTMTHEDLTRLGEERLQAIYEARSSTDPETQAKALDRAADLQTQINDGLARIVQAQEEEKLRAAEEARAAAQKKAGETTNVKRGDLPIDEIRALAAGERSTLSIKVPILEKRTEYDVSTAASGAYGSYLVPQTWADYVVTEEVALSGVMQAGPTIVRTASGAQMNFPKLATDIAAAAGTEGSAATQDTPIFTTVPLNSYRIDGYLNITEELLRDTEIDLNQYLGQLAGRALGQKLAAYLGDEDVGTGSSAPAAITVGATSAVTAASQTAVTLDELKRLYASVLPVYRNKGSFIMNDTVYTSLLLAKDDNGNYIWNPNNVAAAPETLWGRPVYVDSYFDASASGNKPVVFGDVARAYLVREVGAIDVSFSREANFTSFEVVMRYAQWFDAATVDAVAVKMITLA